MPDKKHSCGRISRYIFDNPAMAGFAVRCDDFTCNALRWQTIASEA